MPSCSSQLLELHAESVDILVSIMMHICMFIWADVELGGAYDTVPEVCILLALFENSEKYLPIIFDEAGE